MNFNWDNETTLKFLELYKMNSCIWDPQNKSHKNRHCLNDAWNNIQGNLGIPCSIKELKRKKESLMAAYRGCKHKIKKSERLDADDVYQPTWFAFSFMDSFLGSVYSCNSALYTEETETITDQLVEDSNSDESNQYLIAPAEPNNLSNLEHDYSPVEKRSSITRTPPRKHHNPPELIKAKKQMDQAFNLIKRVFQQQLPNDKDDECSTFGILVAKKLRKLSDERRDVLMVKINQLFVDAHQEFRQNSSSSRLSTTSTTSPPDLFQDVSSPKSSTDEDPTLIFTRIVHEVKPTKDESLFNNDVAIEYIIPNVTKKRNRSAF